MDRTAIFQQLGVGVKFDLKRFEKDSSRLHVKNSSPAPSLITPSNSASVNGFKNHNASSLISNGVASEAASQPEGNAHRQKSKRKRKRKISTVSKNREDDSDDEDEQISSSSAPKRERLSASNASETPFVNKDARINGDDDDNDAAMDDDVNGVIQLMTGVHAGPTPLSADGKQRKKKKKKAKKNVVGDNNNSAKMDEELNAFRNSSKINVKGSDIPDPLRTFEKVGERLKLNPIILANVKKLEFEEPTPIQMQAIPVMAQG